MESDDTEALITTDLSGQLWNACAWNCKTGTSIATFKNGVTASNGLALLGSDYVLCAAYNKPLIYAYSLSGKRQHQATNLIAGGCVCALAVSLDGTLVAGGIGESIHIWQVSTGKQLRVLSHHYQSISCLKFTEDGGYLISGGQDRIIHVWDLYSIFSGSSHDTVEPLFTSTEHTLPVTDLHVGHGGCRARLFSVSQDQTCKVMDLATGNTVASIRFEDPLHAVVADHQEARLFVGAASGNIVMVELFQEPVELDRHIASDQDNVFRGHESKVTALAMSKDDTMLASGSTDHTARLWDIFSHQCVRSFSHQGTVSNLMFTSLLVFVPDRRPQIALQPFQRHINNDDASSGVAVYLNASECQDAGSRDEEDEERMWGYLDALAPAASSSASDCQMNQRLVNLVYQRLLKQ